MISVTKVMIGSKAHITIITIFDIVFNLSNSSMVFTNVTATRFRPRSLPGIYSLFNITLKEMPDGERIISRDAFIFVDPLSLGIFLGLNASYNAEIILRKPEGEFGILKCKKVLFGECVGIEPENYSIDGDWIILDISSFNTSSFSAYGAVDAMPDLEIARIRNEPDYAIRGRNLTIISTIRNNGWSDANNSKIEFLLDGVSKENKTMSIPLTSELDVSFTWVPVNDTYNVTIRADPDNSMNETDETNNKAFYSIAVFEESSFANSTLGANVTIISTPIRIFCLHLIRVTIKLETYSGYFIAFPEA